MMNLYNSAASTCKFLWWIVTDLSMLSSSSNVDCLSSYTGRNALS